MTPNGSLDVVNDRSISGLAEDLFWFALHSIGAVSLLVALVAAITGIRPDVEYTALRLLATALAFLVPMAVALAITWFSARRSWPWAARYVWVSGVLVLAAAAVWVLALPDGPGLCAGCGPAEKLWRTFFVVDRGSGLLNGDGLLVGCWVPLATFGYSLGATLGLRI